MVVRLRANYEFGKQTKFLSRGHIVGIHAKRGNLDKLRLIIAPGSHGQNASMVISDNTDGSEIRTNICILEPGEKKTIKSNHSSFLVCMCPFEDLQRGIIPDDSE